MENENKIIEEKNTKKKSIIVPLLFILAISLIAGGVFLSLNQEETKVVDNEQPVTENEEQQVSQNIKSIELANSTEELVVDEKLKINFIGTASTDTENGYTYKAEIYLNNELIVDNFFTGTNIWSANQAATFDIIKVGETYIIKSFIAKQCNGSYVLVLSSDKTFLTYDDVSLEVNETTGQYTISKCNDCMDTASCTKESFNITK